MRPSWSRARSVWRMAAMVAGLGLLVVAHAAENSAREVEAIYQPYRVAHASLAPDGRRVAFLVRDASAHFTVELFDPADLLAHQPVALPFRGHGTPSYFAWASPTLLVAAFDPALVVTLDVLTGKTATLVDGKTYPNSDGVRHTLRPLMLAGGAPGQLFLELTTTDPSTSEVALDLVRLDLGNGVREVSRVRKFDLPGGALMVDRQGQPRILWPQSHAIQPFLLRSASSLVGAWQPLDRVCTETVSMNFSVRPETFLGERSVPLGFDADPDILYFASNVGRNTRAVFALNVRSGRRTDFTIEDPAFDLVDARLPWGGLPLIFDRARGNLIGLRGAGTAMGVRWLDPEIAAVEKSLQAQFPSREIHALDWDDQRSRFLVWIGSHGDPGRYFVYDCATQRCTEYLRRHAFLASADLNPSEPFACATGPGAGSIHGYLTLPHAPPAKKPPLVIWLHDGPGLRSSPDFNRDTQALAGMGFVVAQADYAGSAGRGLSWQNALQGRPDEAPLANLTAVIRWLDGRGLIDPKRVAVVGEGFGGYLALRTLEQQPDLLRSAVAINAPVDLADLAIDRTFEQADRDSFTANVLSQVGRGRPTDLQEVEAQRAAKGEAMIAAAMASSGRPGRAVDFQREFYSWYFKQFKNLRDASVPPHAGRISKPVLLLHDPAQRYAPIGPVRDLYAGMQRRQQDAAFAEIPRQFAAGSLDARAEVVERIGEFLNVTLYDFKVHLGESKEVK